MTKGNSIFRKWKGKKKESNLTQGSEKKIKNVLRSQSQAGEFWSHQRKEDKLYTLKKINLTFTPWLSVFIIFSLHCSGVAAENDLIMQFCGDSSSYLGNSHWSQEKFHNKVLESFSWN